MVPPATLEEEAEVAPAAVIALAARAEKPNAGIPRATTPSLDEVDGAAAAVVTRVASAEEAVDCVKKELQLGNELSELVLSRDQRLEPGVS